VPPRDREVKVLIETALYAVGHGTLEAERFARLLTSHEISHLVDVRSVPGSRHNPQFGRCAMEEWLPPYSIAYRWEPDLGGFRRASKESANTGLRSPAFRGYADYMQAPTFRTALDRLLAEATRTRTVIMCSETVWWQCHRRLIADAATLLADIDVVHLMHDGKAQPHVVTAPARREDGSVVYPEAAAGEPVSTAT
jgi:uncharacterized protein (DUF488 family)